jgi:1,4-dihydroxy-2-naphthoyl-CoA hydrolase
MIARWSAESWSKVATAAKDSLRDVSDAPPEAAASSRDGLFDALGFELDDHGPEIAHGHFEVTDRVRQRLGIVHGGAYAALAESLTSIATYFAVAEEGMVAMGQSNETSFLRPVSKGVVRAEARSRHRGRTTWVWQVDFTDGEGRLCALARVTIAVGPLPKQP